MALRAAASGNYFTMRSPPKGRISLEGGIYAGRGVGWPCGVDSFSHPLFVNELNLRWLENAVTQGGAVQVRFGNKTVLTFDTNSGAANDWWQSADGPVV